MSHYLTSVLNKILNDYSKTITSRTVNHSNRIATFVSGWLDVQSNLNLIRPIKKKTILKCILDNSKMSIDDNEQEVYTINETQLGRLINSLCSDNP